MAPIRNRKWSARVSRFMVAALAAARRGPRRDQWLRSLRSTFRLYF
jgi:hypothetical protein